MSIYRIFEDEAEINRIVADESFVSQWCLENGYTYELEPEKEDKPMTIIKIEPNDNGSHDNQTSSVDFPVPEGYAILPPEVGTPETLSNYPFGTITVENRDGVPTVTSWTPLPMPEPGPEPEQEPTVEELVNILLGV